MPLPPILIQSALARWLCFLPLLLFLTGCGPRIQKAAWVVRSNIASPEGIEQVGAEAQRGFDTLMVQVRGRGDAYYRSAVAPRAERLAGRPIHFDPLAETLSACRPVPVHAWLNVYYLWGGEEQPRDPRHPALPDQEWIIKDADGRSVAEYSRLDRALGWLEGIYADPGSAAYRKLFLQTVDELVHAYPVAGIHLDFIRYPGAGYGYGGELARRFENLWGLDPRWLPVGVNRQEFSDWLAGTMTPADRVLTTAALLWADMRAAQVTKLVRAVRAVLDTSGRRLELSAAVFPEAGDGYLNKGQDWQRWAAEGLVDALYPMAYFGGPERVGGMLADVAARCGSGPATLWAGLGSYIKAPEIVAREASQAKRLGYQGICLFDLDHLLTDPAGSRPYLEAISGRRAVRQPGSPVADRPPPRPAPPPGPETLGRIAATVLGTGTALDQEAITALWQEFTTWQPQLQALASRLASEPQLVPARVELRGIFRYLHPLDGPAKREAQLAICEEARQRLLAGDDFAAVAADLSQGGSKQMGGRLKQRYLDPNDPVDQLLSDLQPGQFSPVVQVANGFWCFQILEKQQATPAPLADIPWPARRLLLKKAWRQRLSAP